MSQSFPASSNPAPDRPPAINSRFAAANTQPSLFWLVLFNSLANLVLLVVSIIFFLQRQDPAYLYLAGVFGIAFAGYWVGWLVDVRRRHKAIDLGVASQTGPGQYLTPGLIVAALFLLPALVFPVFLFADYWIIALILAFVLILQVGLAGHTRIVPPLTLYLMLVLALMLVFDLWVVSNVFSAIDPLRAAQANYIFPDLTAPANRLAAILGLVLWFIFTLAPILISIVPLRRLPALSAVHEAAGPLAREGRTRSAALSTQLTLLFTAIAAFSIIAVIVVILWQVSTTQTEQIGNSFQTVVEFNAERVGNDLEQQIVLLKSLWYEQTLMYGINTANTEYGFDLYRPETLDELRATDAEWQTAHENSELVRGYTLNQQAQILSSFEASNPRHSSLIVTDRLGALVAATDRKPAHFYYGDEPWWQAAWNDGQGGQYIGELEFDEETGQASILVAVVVKDPQTRGTGTAEAGTTVGVLAATYDLSLIQQDFNSLATASGGPVELVTADGDLVASSVSVPGQAVWNDLRLSGLLSKGQAEWGFMNDALANPAIIAHSPLNSTAQRYTNELKTLGWQVVAYDTRANALASLTRSLKTASLVGILVIAAVVLVATNTAIQLARPVNALTATAAAITGGDLTQRALPAGPLEFYTLAEAFNLLTSRLSQTLSGLEQRVDERTKDLAQRTHLIEAAADVGRAAATILDTDDLFQEVVDLIRSRFDLYYVGLFTVDEASEWANLRAGTGEAGKVMLARGHRIKVGQGMVGWTISNARPRIAGEAGTDAVRLTSAELPLTRAEAALPLISRNRVLGALTVQSERSDAFDPSTVTVLQTMADQVAVALDNARLFAESQQSLDALRRSYGELSRAAWVDTLRTRAVRGYFSDERGIFPVRADENVEPAQAAQSLELALPIKVREQTLGVLHAQKPDGSEAWTDDEAALLNSLVDQLSVALENARLYEDTQRLADRQRVAAEVSARIRESLDIDTVLQTAVSEMRRAIGLEEIVIRLGDIHEQQ